MSACLSISVTPWVKLWRQVITRLCMKLGSWPLIYTAIEIEPPVVESPVSLHQEDNLNGRERNKLRGRLPPKGKFYILKAKKDESKKNCNSGSGTENMEGSATVPKQVRHASNGGSGNFSLYMRRGRKAINQDAMIVLENFASQEEMVFCGVFDGHGSDGHRVARTVRDILPEKLAASWKSQKMSERSVLFSSDESENECVTQELTDYNGECMGDPSLIMAWKESFITAYKITDRQLLMNNFMDCVSSGSTAVSLVKQGKDLIIGNVGDSRAVLGTRMDDNTVLALPLTVDQKPNIPREAERIRSRKGRVFAPRNEPLVHRVWLPNQNLPGLAMARALGDYCVKKHGVISEPEVTYRRLTKKDEFVVLATDGIWDVLTNEQVVEIVASASDRSQVARAIVEKTIHALIAKNAASNIDDCAVVCLFL